jgi:hypothetical protein
VRNASKSASPAPPAYLMIATSIMKKLSPSFILVKIIAARAVLGPDDIIESFLIYVV